MAELTPKQRILSLPQARHFTEERINHWLQAVQQVEADRLGWHIARLNGFGGSDIGVLVAEFHGLTDPFTSAREIVASKLLMNVPEQANGPMKRGQMLEPVIQQMFMEYMGQFGQVSHDAAAFEQLKRGKSHHFPWMRYSPDDVITLDGRRYLIDYKSPTEYEYDKTGLPMRYCAQLHQGRAVGIENGIQFDGMLLCVLDLAKWEVKVSEVPFESELELAVFEAGNHYWNEYVLKGLLPEANRKPDFDKALLKDVQDIEDKVTQLIVFDQLQKSADTHTKRLKDTINLYLQDYKISGSKLSLGQGILNVTAKTKFNAEKAIATLGEHIDSCRLPGDYDIDQMAKRLAEFGVDIETMRLPGEGLDEVKMQAKLIELGHKLEDFQTESLTLKITQAKSGPAIETLTAIKADAAEMIKTSAEKLIGDLQFAMSPSATSSEIKVA